MTVGQGLFRRSPATPVDDDPSGRGARPEPRALRPAPPLTDRTRFLDQLAASEVQTLLVVDLDDFRMLNETMGYQVGDEVLAECATRLARSVPAGATLARIGDDEFAAHWPGGEDPGLAAERCRDAMRTPMMCAGRPQTVTASLGVVVAEDADDGSLPLLQAADGALERAKARGGDRFEVFDPVLLEQARRRAQIAQDLRRGLQARQFLVHYQPQVSMQSGLIRGVEALVRWHHPVDGLISPGAFVPIAEETGLIRQLGAVVLNRACADAVALLERRRSDGPFTVSVNISTVQMQDSGLVETVADALDRSGLDPARLCLEVTESAVLGTSLRMESVLDQLKRLGVQFSIDDFGTGYSSLSYLRRLPVDELKIDRSFIVELGNRQGREMVEAICAIAHALHLEIVAEGVDDADAIPLLRGMGCDVVQGFLYFKPEPLDKVLRAIRRDRPRALPDPA